MEGKFSDRARAGLACDFRDRNSLLAFPKTSRFHVVTGAECPHDDNIFDDDTRRGVGEVKLNELYSPIFPALAVVQRQRTQFEFLLHVINNKLS